MTIERAQSQHFECSSSEYYNTVEMEPINEHQNEGEEENTIFHNQDHLQNIWQSDLLRQRLISLIYKNLHCQVITFKIKLAWNFFQIRIVNSCIITC